MTTKDYVYLGMILLTALAFYCNGFYAGVYRCKRMYDSITDEDASDSTPLAESLCDAKIVSTEEKTLATEFPERGTSIVFSDRELRKNFGNN